LELGQSGSFEHVNRMITWTVITLTLTLTTFDKIMLSVDHDFVCTSNQTKLSWTNYRFKNPAGRPWVFNKGWTFASKYSKWQSLISLKTYSNKSGKKMCSKLVGSVALDTIIVPQGEATNDGTVRRVMIFICVLLLQASCNNWK
jgi:hypothetical protein